jgi:hypothetical protein
LNLLILLIFIDYSLQVRIKDTSRHSSAALMFCFAAALLQAHIKDTSRLSSGVEVCFTAALLLLTAALLLLYCRRISEIQVAFRVASKWPP